MAEAFLGLAELNLIGTDTYRFKEKFAHRYCFQSARVIDHGGTKMLETDRFYVWAESIDTAYKIAVDHMYRDKNKIPHDAVDRGEGGSLYEQEIDEQHKEIILDSYDDWYKLMNASNGFERDDFYLGD